MIMNARQQLRQQKQNTDPKPPFDIFERDNEWLVCEQDDDHDCINILGRHDTEDAAVEQLQAIYANLRDDAGKVTATASKPYDIFKDNGDYQVYKVDSDGNRTGSALGTHDTRNEAENQLAALYANEDDAKANRKGMKGGIVRYDQTEVNYRVKAEGNQVCANCRFYDADYWSKCAIVHDEQPYPIVSGGVCDAWVGLPMMMDDMAEEEDDTSGEDEPVRLPMPNVARSARTGMQWLADTLKSLFGQSDTQPAGNVAGGFKMVDNQDYDWIGWWTNNFKDVELEIISEKAIADAVQRANNGDAPMPELWWMHIPGTRHGKATKLFQVGHFSVAIGTFDDPAENKFVPLMKKWYDKIAKSGNVPTMSHQFRYDRQRKIDGVYHHIEPFELSAIIAGREANPYTAFVEKIDMVKITKRQREELIQHLGEDAAKLVIQQASAYGKQLEAEGVEFRTRSSSDAGMSTDTLVILSQMKQLTDAVAQTKGEGETERVRMQSRIATLEDTLDTVAAKLDRVNTLLIDITRKTPRPSEAQSTIVDPDDPHSKFLADNDPKDGQKNHEPIFNQMLKMPLS